jgi:hypothetical protein
VPARALGSAFLAGGAGAGRGAVGHDAGKVAFLAISASRSFRTFASVRLRSTVFPLRTADHLMPGHWPVASSIFALMTRKPFVLSAAANSAAVICGTKGAAPRAYFIFNVFLSGEKSALAI